MGNLNQGAGRTIGTTTAENSAPDHARLRHISDALDLVYDAVLGHSNRLRMAMDNVLGCDPQDAAVIAPTPPPCGIADEIRQKLLSIGHRLNDVRKEIERVERVAL